MNDALVKPARFIAALLFAAAYVCFFESACAKAEEYHLGLGDVVNVEILIMDNQDFGDSKQIGLQSGNIRIGPDGRISVPIIGSVFARKLTTNQLAQNVAKELRVEIPVAFTPYVTVTIGSYRPVSILGAVKSPGSYDFTPGMTIRELLARSGGLNILELSEIPVARVIDTLAERTERQMNLDRALLSRERLLAEIEGATTFGSENKNSELQADVAREEKLFDLRHRERLQASAHLRAEVERTASNVDVLRENLSVLGEQVAAAEREAERRNDLDARGLTVAGAIFQVQNLVNELESRRLQAQEDLQLSERQIALAQHKLAQDELNRTIGLIGELRTLDMLISSLGIRLQRDDIILSNGGLKTSHRPSFEFWVFSQRDKTGPKLKGRETVLQPGDVVEVVMASDEQVSQ